MRSVSSRDNLRAFNLSSSLMELVGGQENGGRAPKTSIEVTSTSCHIVSFKAFTAMRSTCGPGS